MSYSSLEDALRDLARHGHLASIPQEVDPYLEMAEIARQAYMVQAPAILFEHVKGSPFRAVCNLFGTTERVHFLFRDTLRAAETAIRAKADPAAFLKKPSEWARLPFIGLHALPRKAFTAPVLAEACNLSDLPQLQCYAEDGGAFLTLPQVLSENPNGHSILESNLGMYRVQISGNEYKVNKECGLHYQIDRGIAAHHEAALAEGKPLKVTISLGGPPAHTIAAIMPMPEGLSELTFAGILAGRSFQYRRQDGWCIPADADFCILAETAPDLKPEGPFGDHLGYYSAKHPFPYLRVKQVYYRHNAIFPFTAVGRPPQEDTEFGKLIGELTRPMVPASIPGLFEINAVDSAGVHPLLLAIGKERYVPYAPREPMELLTIANALLGFNQTALAKYLIIAAREDSSRLSTRNVPAFFKHVLERIDFSKDLHFQTATTIDTLDYSGTALNHGSKVVIAAAGEARRTLGNTLADYSEGFSLPEGFSAPKVIMPGILVIQGSQSARIPALCEALAHWEHREKFPWITVADDSGFASEYIDNWLWVTFTRSDPAQDIYGANARIDSKHWECDTPLVIDARKKPQMQKPLETDPKIERRAADILSPVLKAQKS